MALLGVVAGLWFVVMGVWAMNHAEHGAADAAGHWMSFPTGRRIGGALAILLGAAVAAGSVAWL